MVGTSENVSAVEVDTQQNTQEEQGSGLPSRSQAQTQQPHGALFGDMEVVVAEQTEINQAQKEEHTQKAYKEKTLAVLQKEGFFRRDEDGNYIVYINKFRQMKWSKYRDAIRVADNGTEYRKDAITTLFNTFSDKKVYSEEDYAARQQGKESEPKNLFYVPKDKDAALDISQIRESNFYLGLWELGEKQKLPENYPTEVDGLSSTLSTHEAITACLIYHPQYGNGERTNDQRRKLMVDFSTPTNENPGERTRKPISYKFFESWRYYGAPGLREVNVTFAPALFFVQRAPNMIDKGLIDPMHDFDIMQGSRTEQRFGMGQRLVTANGTMQVNGLKYFVGRDNEGLTVYKISDKLAALVEKDKNDPVIKKVVQLHTLFPDQVSKLMQVSPDNRYVSTSHIQVDTPEEYLKKVPEAAEVVDNFETYLEFARRISRDEATRFDISDLSVKEQGFAAALYKDYSDDDRFWRFLRTYKIDGLRVLMVAKGSFGDAERVWDVSGKLRPSIFKDVAEIMSKVTAYHDDIRSQLTEEDKLYGDQVADMIVDYTGKLLLSTETMSEGAYADESKPGQPLDIADVEYAIRRLREKIDRMYAKRFGIQSGKDEYQELLDVYAHAQNDHNVRALALSKMEQMWQEDIATEDNLQVVQKVEQATKEFYAGNAELYDTADETTGDTSQHREQFLQYALAREGEGKPITGTLVDMGCGQVSRMTDFIAKTLPEVKVIGIDLETQTLVDAAKKEHEPNVQLASGNFAHIPLPDSSASVVTANWSIVNDLLLQKLQLESFDEVARILPIGGEFRFDAPSLEGEVNGEEGIQTKNYLPEAIEYHKHHPNEPFGIIEKEFPGGYKKKFYIYPKVELQAKLERAGFEIVDWKEWAAHNGLVRQTCVARLKSKITPTRLQ